MTIEPTTEPHPDATHGPPPDATPPVETIDTDVVCLGCAYNLRGLRRDALCPECGFAVERSLRGNVLRYSNPAWLARVLRGLRLVYGVILAVLGAIVVTFFLLVAVAGLNLAGFGGAFGLPIEPVLRIAGIVLLAPLLVLPACYPIGWWFVTTPDPTDDERRTRERVVLRLTALLFLPVMATWFMLRYGRPVALTADPRIIELGTNACFLLVWLHVWTLVRMARRLEGRCVVPGAIIGIADRRHARILTTLRTTERRVTWVPLVLFVMHWIFAGPALAGMASFRGLGMFWMTILWLLSLNVVGSVRDRVRTERRAQQAA